MTSTVATQPLLLFSLANRERLLVGVGRQAAARQCLAISQRGHLRVPHAPCPCQVGHQLRVKRLAAPHEVRVISLGRPEQIVRGRPVSPPVRPQLPAEKLVGVDLVIGDHEVARDGFGMNPSQVEDERQAGRLIVGGAGHTGIVAIRNVAPI